MTSVTYCYIVITRISMFEVLLARPNNHSYDTVLVPLPLKYRVNKM